MTIYKFRDLPNDIARCVGTNCQRKQSCARHLQIERDTAHYKANSRRFVGWIAYTDALRDGADICEIHMEDI